MSSITSISSTSCHFSSSSFVSEDDAQKLRLPDVVKITAEECIKNLRIGHNRAKGVKALREESILKTTDRLEKLKLKHCIVCNKHVLDFTQNLIKRLERTPDYCHHIYDKYQTFLETHTSLQCVPLYEIFQDPTVAHDFVMEFIPFHKKAAREIQAEGLNILSLGNNRRVFSNH